jgi:hypothetical protein
MTSTTIVNKKLSVLSIGSPTSYKNRQSTLYRELELLLDLTPSTFSSPLLQLPAELRAQIFAYLLPPLTDVRPELHTCLWGAEMHAVEPWRHSIVGYGSRVPISLRLPPQLLLISKKLRDEVLRPILVALQTDAARGAAEHEIPKRPFRLQSAYP